MGNGIAEALNEGEKSFYSRCWSSSPYICFCINCNLDRHGDDDEIQTVVRSRKQARMAIKEAVEKDEKFYQGCCFNPICLNFRSNANDGKIEIELDDTVDDTANDPNDAVEISRIEETALYQE